jgi:hypothetical protein
MAKLKPGARAVLTKLPPGLLDGLPEEDQTAISAIVGKRILFVGYDEDGRVELEFTDSEGIIHSIYVSPEFVKSASLGES